MALKLPTKSLFGGININETSTNNQGQLQTIDYITENGVLTAASGNATSIPVVIYTVPVGKVFYLVSGQLSLWHNTGTPNETSALHITLSANPILILIGKTAESTQSTAISFAIPIRLKAGETIQISIGSAANNRVFGSVTGYLLNA